MHCVGVGTDVVEIDRFRAVLQRRANLSERLFSIGEREYAATFSDPAPRLAARFAAKEAVMKALGVGIGAFDLQDVEVQRAQSGAPSLALSGRAAELAAAAGVSEWQLSLSHSESVAMAVAIALGNAAPEGRN
jgi:holo-[acyl-carrier protein] synthase